MSLVISGSRRVSMQQLDILWDYLNSHRDLAVAYNRSLQDKEHACRKWKEVTVRLNAQVGGALKDWKGWCKYWVDYKAKLKKRALAVRYWQRKKDGPFIEQPLADMDRRFLDILGQDVCHGATGGQGEPQPSGSTTTEPPFQIPVSKPSPASDHVPDPIIDPTQIVDPVLSATKVLDSVKPPPASISDLPSMTPISDPSQVPISDPLPIRPRWRRRRRDISSHQVLARALLNSSGRREETRSSRVLESIAQSMVQIKDSLQGISSTLIRIERAINDGLSRPAE